MNIQFQWTCEWAFSNNEHDELQLSAVWTHVRISVYNYFMVVWRILCVCVVTVYKHDLA